jgi:hypothetical protein
MIIFHPRQSDCARRACKNEKSVTFNFTSRIASSICTVAFTKCEKFGATIFTSRRSRLSLVCIFRQGHALPLSFVRFLQLANGLSKNRRSPARRSRNGRESSGETSGKISRSIPHIDRAIAGQWQTQCHQMAARQLARQLASWRATVTQCPRHSPRNNRCNISRNVSQDDCPEFSRHLLKYDSQKL